MARFEGNWDTGERRNFRRILVVGGGRAGVAAAEELRRQGFGGEIIVMCDEPDAPYDRPSCSKGLLNGNKRPKDAKMPVQDDLAIQWELGRKAVWLDAANRAVVADTNEEYRYDGLVIATGARPMWPKGWPPKGEPGLYGLHGMSDAWQLRRALQRARRVAIVGGGLTGCEVACTVRALARDCVLVDSKPQVMSRALGEVVGRYVTEEVAKDGVELRLSRRVKQVDRGRKGRWVLVLDDGSEEEADIVVGTIGEKPDLRWLADSGFDISDGVLCDENLRVVGAEDVVACGTVARWPNLRYSTEPRRVGQWIMALEQGRAAAASLLRSDSPARPAALIPRYWSEQFGLRIQVCGEVPTDGSAEMTVSRQRPGRRDTARAGVLVGYHRNGEQIGLVGVNAVRAFTTTARMMLAAPPRLVESEQQHAAALPAGAPRLALEAGYADRPAPAAAYPERLALEAGYADRPAGPAYPDSRALVPAYAQGPPPGYYHEAPPPGYYQEAPPPGYYHEAPPPGHPQGPPPGYYQEAPPPGYPAPPEYAYPERPALPAAPVSPSPRDRFDGGRPVLDAPPDMVRDNGPVPEPPPYDQYDPRPYQHEPGYGYEPTGEYGRTQSYQPAHSYDPLDGYDPYARHGNGPGHAYEEAPVSPSVSQLSPRDRFATDQFAAVR